MSDKGLIRLASIAKLNADPAWVNNDLYRLMFREDLYVAAYEGIKSKPGNMTPGIDGSTLDGTSLEGTIRPIIEAIRSESFQFSKGRRIYIPKASGKGMRPLTIAPPREKMVQEVMRMIIEAIYDSPEGPTFRGSSHGFRHGRGTHTALETIRRDWDSTNWFIEGDIEGCFDNIDHHVLVDLLRRRIEDERFLNLVWKALRAGYMEGTTGFNADLGTPQGSIVSPILANVYLHELDLFVESLRARHEKGDKRKPNPEYRAIQRRRLRLEKKVGRSPEESAEIKELAKRQRELPSFVPNDPDYIRIRYVRYADDWLVGVIGPKSLAMSIRDEIKEFLAETLHLTLSEEKTHIRHAKSEDAKFLGTLLRIQAGGLSEAKVASITRTDGTRFRRRSTGWAPSMRMPAHDIVKRLHQKGFCSAQGEPRSMKAWVFHTHDDILMRFSATLRGIANYYSFADNRAAMSRVQNILHLSAAKTLAQKFRLRSMRRTFAKFGRSLTARTEAADGKVRETHLWLMPDFIRRPLEFQRGNPPRPLGEVYAARLTRSHLGACCCVCGSSDRIEMHHVRHVRKAGQRQSGFTKVMGLINRKQIPVCGECHRSIHQGKYDGISLANFAYNPVGRHRR